MRDKNDGYRGWWSCVAFVCVMSFCILGSGVAILKARPPARVPAAAYTQEQATLYEAMYERSQVPSGVALANMADWSDEAVAEVVAAALLTVTEPTSLATWKPGYVAWLRDTMGLDRQAVIDAVYDVYALRAWMIADAVLARGEKPE